MDGGMGLASLVLLLAFAISVLSGLLGIGGGIVMAPALLYLPPLLGVGELDMRQVSGLTITQGLFACLSAATRHDRQGLVHRRLVGWMGGCIGLSALAGSVLSGWTSSEVLMALFAGLALVAAALMVIPISDRDQMQSAHPSEFQLPRALLVAGAVGMLGGMVGQGGSFLLIPLMLHVLKLPTRVVIGSSLGIVFLSSLAGFAGKLATGQVPLLLAAVLVAGALPGAWLGSLLSQRSSPKFLRTALAVVIGLAALRIAADVVARG